MKKITKLIFASALVWLVCFAGTAASQAIEAGNQANIRSRGAVSFIDTGGTETTDTSDSSGDSSDTDSSNSGSSGSSDGSDNTSDSSGGTHPSSSHGGTSGSGNSSGGGKTIGSLGETAGNLLLALAGAGLLIFAVIQLRKKQQS